MAVWDSAGQRTRSSHSHRWLAGALPRSMRGCAAARRCSNIPAIPPASFASISVPRPVRSFYAMVRACIRVSVSPDCTSGTSKFRRCLRAGPRSRGRVRCSAQCAISLRELASYLASRRDLNDVALISADVPSGTGTQSAQLARIMGRYGFEAIVEREHLSHWRAPASLRRKYPDFAVRLCAQPRRASPRYAPACAAADLSVAPGSGRGIWSFAGVDVRSLSCHEHCLRYPRSDFVGPVAGRHLPDRRGSSGVYSRCIASACV